MLSVENKIEGFKRLLRYGIDESNKDELDELAKQTDKKIRAFEEKIKKLRQDTKRELDAKQRVKVDKIMSKNQAQGQNMLLDKMSEIRCDFDKSLKESIKKEYSGEKGEAFLQRALRDLDKDQLANSVFLVGEEFEQRDRQIIQSFAKDANVQTTPIIKLGGFIIDNEQKTVRINCSVDFALSSKKERIDRLLNLFIDQAG